MHFPLFLVTSKTDLQRILDMAQNQGYYSNTRSYIKGKFLQKKHPKHSIAGSLDSQIVKAITIRPASKKVNLSIHPSFVYDNLLDTTFSQYSITTVNEE